MIPNAKTCLYPREPAEAVRLLSELGRRALLLAGGTSAVLSRSAEVDTLIDLSRMGCDRIEAQEDGLRIGCSVRLADLARHEAVIGFCNGMLADAAAAVGSLPIRNAATLGGNLVQCYRWSDPPVALLALGAQVELLGPAGPRRLSVEELLQSHPRKVLAPAELVLSVHIARAPGRVGAFLKLARTATDTSIVGAAVCLDLQGPTVGRARVAIGGSRGLPYRAEEAEAALVGQAPGAAAFARAATLSREAARPMPDARTSREFRERMIEVVVRRALERAAGHLDSDRAAGVRPR